MQDKIILRQKIISRRKLPGLNYKKQNRQITGRLVDIITNCDYELSRLRGERGNPQDYLSQDLPICVTTHRRDDKNSPKIIGGYIALPGEPDLTCIFQEYKDKWHFAVPKIDEINNQFWFTSYSYGDQLEKSSKGFMQPVTTFPTTIQKVRPDIVIVPGLSFDRKGYRLGFGAGYYDKYLSDIKHSGDCIKIGVCFDDYLQNQIPREEHDVKFDFIITDKTFIKL